MDAIAPLNDRLLIVMIASGLPRTQCGAGDDCRQAHARYKQNFEYGIET
jgi:hypothetical protein